MKSVKIANAGYRVLEILKELVHHPLSLPDLLLCIEETTDENFRQELILKYINTLRLLDLNVIKVNKKYCLQNSIEKIHYNRQDISLFLFLKEYSKKINHETLKDNLIEILQFIERTFSKNTKKLVTSKKISAYHLKKSLEIRDTNIEKFEKYCEDKQKIDIIYNYETKNQIFYRLAPIKVIYKKGKAVLVTYDAADNCYKEFFAENIITSKQSPQKQPSNFSASVLFKLKNRLAKSYRLKPDETVLEYTNDYMLISNKTEDKELLIKRLLRYYNECEIIYPEACRERLVELVTQMEQLYYD